MKTTPVLVETIVYPGWPPHTRVTYTCHNLSWECLIYTPLPTSGCFSLCPQPSVAARHDLTPPSLAGVYHFLSTVARWNSNRNMFASAERFLSDEDDDAVWACSWSTAERLVWWWWWWWWCCGCAACCIPALISAETDGRAQRACAVISTTLYKVWCTDTVIMRFGSYTALVLCLN